MGKKRYWHRKQLDVSGNALPDTLGRRRNSKEKDPWKNGYVGFAQFWLTSIINWLSHVIIAPKINKKNEPSVQVTVEPGVGHPIFEIRIRELLIFIFGINMASLFMVNTEFVPDEYWQSTEVAHKHVFGQGHLTWEWETGLRSYLFPMVHIGYFKILKYFGLDSPFIMITGARLFNVMLVFVGEVYFFLAGAISYGFVSSLYSVLMFISSWFVFYCSSRLITNTTEMALNMISMYYFEAGKIKTFTFILAINFSFRPTAIVIWFPQLFVIITKMPKKIFSCLLIGLSTLGVLAYIDSVMYGYWVLPLWNFVLFNFLQGRSAEFGTHPLLWYLYNAVPSIFLFDTLTFFEVFYKARNLPRYYLKMTSITSFFAFFSIVGHKEIRFVLPVLPFVYSVFGDYQYESVKLKNGTIKKSSEHRLITKSMWMSIAVHVLVALYFASEHQGGIKPATNFINSNIASKTKESPRIWVLMPCYSVPVHTYMHNLKAEFEYFTCAPSKLHMETKMPNFQRSTFAKVNLTEFFSEKLNEGRDKAPDYIMAFSKLSARVRYVAQSFNLKYRKCFSMGHVRLDDTLHPQDVHVLCRSW